MVQKPTEKPHASVLAGMFGLIFMIIEMGKQRTISLADFPSKKEHRRYFEYRCVCACL